MKALCALKEAPDADNHVSMTRRCDRMYTSASRQGHDDGDHRMSNAYNCALQAVCLVEEALMSFTVPS